jgi:hypothetical protein
MRFHAEVAEDALDVFPSEYECSSRTCAALESRAQQNGHFVVPIWIMARVDPHPVDLAVLHFQRVVVCSIVALSHRGQEI